jgi:hypothetical protein
MKDGEDGREYAFRLSEVTIGEDEDGFPVTSCVVEHRGTPARRAAAVRPLTPVQQIVLRALGDAVSLDGSGVAFATLKQMAVDQIPVDLTKKKDNRHRDVGKAIEVLTASGYISTQDGGLLGLAEKSE